MAEFTAIQTQTVQPNQNILFNETVVNGNCSILHREGSGIVSLRNTGNQCKALFQIEYSGNIAVATGGTVGPISLAIAVEGEGLGASVGTVTPAAIGDFFNVSMIAQVYVPKCCCASISVENISTTAIDVANSNLTITRLA